MAYDLQNDIQNDIKLQEPKKYKVLLLNDDYSTMEFVIDVLVSIFKKTIEDSTKLMLEVHNNGKAVCGVYTYELASTKVAQVKNKARKSGYPLKAILEEEI